MKYKGYTLALAVSIAYSIWYLGSGTLLSLSPLASPIFPLMLIESISTVLVFIFARGRIGLEKWSDVKYPVLSALAYSFGNFLFYTVIVGSGVPSASAFAAAEIVIFTLLLWLFSKHNMNMSLYSLASVIIATGLITESLVLRNGFYSLNLNLVGLGILIAVLYGVATYFYYLSVNKIKKSFTTMFYIQAPQAIAYFTVLLLFVPASAFPKVDTAYLLLAAAIGVILFASFALETAMMKTLSKAGQGAVATGYILSDMQLIPVLVYFLAANPSAWEMYAPGLLLVTVGLALLDWR